MPHLEVKIVDEHGRIVPHGVTGELLHARLFGHARILGRRDEDARVDRRGRLDAHAAISRPRRRRVTAASWAASRTWSFAAARTSIRARWRSFSTGIPKIQDVQCVGVPDAKYGEELCACIILRPGTQASAEEIREFCRGQIAHYKVPRYVKIRRLVSDDGHRQGAEIRAAEQMMAAA